METCLNYTNRDTAFFSSDERRFVNKVRKLKEQYPDQVRIISEPEENDGCIYCRIPVSWFAIRVPKKRILTDEEKQVLSERMKQIRKHD